MRSQSGTQICTQKYYEVSLNEVSSDLRLGETEEVQNHGHKKKDWKLFRERLSGWQENYMEGLVKEYVKFLNDDKKPAVEKFWELEKRIKEDKRHPGVIMELKKIRGNMGYCSSY